MKITHEGTYYLTADLFSPRPSSPCPLYPSSSPSSPSPSSPVCVGVETDTLRVTVCGIDAHDRHTGEGLVCVLWARVAGGGRGEGGGLIVGKGVSLSPGTYVVLVEMDCPVGSVCPTVCIGAYGSGLAVFTKVEGLSLIDIHKLERKIWKDALWTGGNPFLRANPEQESWKDSFIEVKGGFPANGIVLKKRVWNLVKEYGIALVGFEIVKGDQGLQMTVDLKSVPGFEVVADIVEDDQAWVRIYPHAPSLVLLKYNSNLKNIDTEFHLAFSTGKLIDVPSKAHHDDVKHLVSSMRPKDPEYTVPPEVNPHSTKKIRLNSTSLDHQNYLHYENCSPRDMRSSSNLDKSV